MLKARSALELSVFVFLGVSAAYVMSSSHNTTSVLLLPIGAASVLLLLVAFTHASTDAISVLKSFTWWQSLWLFLFVSGLVFRDRDIQTIEAEPLDAWAIFRIALVTVTGIVLFLRLALRQTHWLQPLFRGLIGFLASYGLVCVTTSLWSVYPSWTLYKSAEYLVDIILLAAIVATARSVETYKRLFDWTWTLIGLLLLSIWLGLLFRPQGALLPTEGLLQVQLSGVMPDVHPNTVGELGAVVGLIAITRLLHNKRSGHVWYGLLLAIGLLTMCLAQSRSAILGFVVGMILVLLFSGRPRVSLLLAFATVVILSIAGVSQTISDYMRRGETENQLYTLSSRVEWWSFALPRIMERPLTGYGAYAGTRFLVMAEYKLDVAGIHSDWVETLVGAGLWGLIPALFALIATWRQLIKSARNSSLRSLEWRLAVEAVGILALVSVRSIFTNDLFWHPPVVFFASMGYAQFLRDRERHRAAAIPPILATHF